MNEFLRSIKKDPSRVDFQAMINILITHAQSPEEMLQVPTMFTDRHIWFGALNMANSLCVFF